MSRLKHSDGSCSKSFWDLPLVEGPGNCAIANCTIFSGRTIIPTPITWKSLTDAVNGGNSRGNADHPLHWTQRPSKVHYTFYRWPTPHLWCIRLWGSRRLSPAQTTGREFLVQIIAKLRLLSRREESHIETLPLANPDVKDAAIIG